ncbi:hypothetical protein NCCP691_07460 [Noviherbaspirillum aridicola]|uniref:Uncharacterized protein n=2 Tax=Noviherbaspirillum aridicola TaxID=2849687 RepID=A0ABQ4Q100_9BURK|nr:hypothetical protein NCCP691_07460 [Noviherbaspirillum aridicola]
MHDQKERRHQASRTGMAERLRERLAGAATLSSCEAPPAIQLGGWSPTAATELVRTLHWEQRKLDPGQADVVELAHAIACGERWRADGDRRWRDEAISALLRAFSMDETLDIETLSQGYAAGSTGYEQKGKSIWSNYLSQLGAFAMLTGVESAAAAATVSSGMALAQAYNELNTGRERMVRKPQEDLAAALSVNLAKRAASTPAMNTAAKLTDRMRKAPALAKRLREAIEAAEEPGGRSALEALLKEADETVFASENAIKHRLNISAENWACRWREAAVRSGAAGLIAGGSVAAAFAPPAAPIAIPAALAGAAGLHLMYRVSDWDGKDASRGKLKQLFNFIKSADWIDRRKMAPARIAEMYEKFESGRMTREDLANELNRAGAIDAGKLSALIVLPVSMRMSMASVLLRGKLAEVLDKLARTGPAGMVSEDVALMRAVSREGKGNPGEAVLTARYLLTDVFNLRRAGELAGEAGDADRNGDHERRDRALAAAADHLLAVRDDEARALFERDMKEQTRAAARALSLQKDVADRYRYCLGAGAMTGLMAGGVYGAVNNCLRAADLSDGAITAGGFGATVPPSFVVSPLGPAYKRHAPDPAAAPGDNAPVTLQLHASDKPATPYQLPPDAVVSLLKSGRVPQSVAFEWEHGGKTQRQINGLTDLQPYYYQQQRSLGRLGRAKSVWKKVVGGVADAVDSTTDPLLGPAVAYRMRATRAQRRELHRLADQANDVLRGGATATAADEPAQAPAATRRAPPPAP